MTIAVEIAIGWVACGVITAGTTVAYFQRKWPTLAKGQYRDDLNYGIFNGLFGPVGLVLSAFLSRFWQYGWTLLPPKD